jgi:hypothetical protein
VVPASGFFLASQPRSCAATALPLPDSVLDRRAGPLLDGPRGAVSRPARRRGPFEKRRLTCREARRGVGATGLRVTWRRLTLRCLPVRVYRRGRHELTLGSAAAGGASGRRVAHPSSPESMTATRSENLPDALSRASALAMDATSKPSLAM